jgi:Winged helix-turn helix
VTEHDVLVGYRLRLFTLAEKLGNVSRACRLTAVHRSTYYRLKKQVDRWGLEALMCASAGAADARPDRADLEQRIVAFALAHAAFGPADRGVDSAIALALSRF